MFRFSLQGRYGTVGNLCTGNYQYGSCSADRPCQVNTINQTLYVVFLQ